MKPLKDRMADILDGGVTLEYLCCHHEILGVIESNRIADTDSIIVLANLNTDTDMSALMYQSNSPTDGGRYYPFCIMDMSLPQGTCPTDIIDDMYNRMAAKDSKPKLRIV